MAAGFYTHHRRAIGIAGWTIASIIIALFILSYFIDPFIRARMEKEMNAKLVGYHTQLARAHLQLLTGTLTLYGIKIIQNAHPDPPVADIDELEAQIDLDALLAARIVATFTLYHPKVHIDLAQLETERTNKVPIKKQGWQDAVEAIYPVKINRLKVVDGAATYIDKDPQHPLNLTHLNLIADNIRNVKAPRATYPSAIHLDTIAFDQGKIQLDGNANFFAEPFTAIKAHYWVSNLPLSHFEPVAQRANLNVSGGVLDSKGMVEYSPKVRNVEVYNATVSGINLNYVHMAQTATAEARRAEEVKTAAKKANNQPGLILKVDAAAIKNSRVAYTDQVKNPPYQLFISDLDVHATNISNQYDQGGSTFNVKGKFMDSGDTTMTGNFRPQKQGPDFKINLAIQRTDMMTMNDLLQAYGRLRVARGDFSLYTQMTANQGHVDGYVKPLFSNLQVYNYQKDKNKPVLQQAYKLAVGAVADVFKNRSTDKVATVANVSGKIDQPNVSTWQAVGQLIENAFIKTILPGFDREAKAGRADGTK